MDFEQLNGMLTFNGGQIYIEHNNKLVGVKSDKHFIEETNFDFVDDNPEFQSYKTTSEFSDSLEVTGDFLNAIQTNISSSTNRECELYECKQIRQHRKKRINKKWNKKYGIKTINVKKGTYAVESVKSAENGLTEITLKL